MIEFWILIWFVYNVPTAGCNDRIYFETFCDERWEVYTSSDTLYEKYNLLGPDERKSARIFAGNEFVIKPMYSALRKSIKLSSYIPKNSDNKLEDVIREFEEAIKELEVLSGEPTTNEVDRRASNRLISLMRTHLQNLTLDKKVQ